jgi:hypothetical protein
MSEELAVLGADTYQARVTNLKTGGRRDVEVTPNDPNLPASFDQTDVIAVLRRFFDQLEAEAQEHRGDPVATSQALARMEALLADVRSVRDSIKTLAAEALNDERVRRLTVSGVCTVEGTSEIKRSNWQHAELMAKILNTEGLSLLNTAEGEVIHPEQAAELLLGWFNPTWKLTALKSLSINPDDYCDVQTDDEDRPVRTPTVRMVDNLVRRRDNITTTGGNQ